MTSVLRNGIMSALGDITGAAEGYNWCCERISLLLRRDIFGASERCHQHYGLRSVSLSTAGEPM